MFGKSIVLISAQTYYLILAQTFFILLFYYLFLAQTFYLFLFNYFLILAQIIISQKRPEIINRHLKCRMKLGLKMYLDGKTGWKFPRHGRYPPCHGNPSRLTVGFPVTRDIPC